MRNRNSRIPDFNTFKTASGDEFHIEYASKFNNDGTISLSESGRTDIQAKIQSHLAETDMSIIVSKLMYGDTSVLSHKQPMYGDFTQMPKSYAEILELMNNSEEAFESLPVDIKAKFDNDFNKWFSTAGSESWLSSMGLVRDVQSEPVEDTAISKPVVKE